MENSVFYVWHNYLGEQSAASSEEFPEWSDAEFAPDSEPPALPTWSDSPLASVSESDSFSATPASKTAELPEWSATQQPVVTAETTVPEQVVRQATVPAWSAPTAAAPNPAEWTSTSPPVVRQPPAWADRQPVKAGEAFTDATSIAAGSQPREFPEWNSSTPTVRIAGEASLPPPAETPPIPEWELPSQRVSEIPSGDESPIGRDITTEDWNGPVAADEPPADQFPAWEQQPLTAPPSLPAARTSPPATSVASAGSNISQATMVPQRAEAWPLHGPPPMGRYGPVAHNVRDVAPAAPAPPATATDSLPEFPTWDNNDRDEPERGTPPAGREATPEIHHVASHATSSQSSPIGHGENAVRSMEQGATHAQSPQGVQFAPDAAWPQWSPDVARSQSAMPTAMSTADRRQQARAAARSKQPGRQAGGQFTKGKSGAPVVSQLPPEWTADPAVVEARKSVEFPPSSPSGFERPAEWGAPIHEPSDLPPWEQSGLPPDVLPPTRNHVDPDGRLPLSENFVPWQVPERTPAARVDTMSGEYNVSLALQRRLLDAQAQASREHSAAIQEAAQTAEFLMREARAAHHATVRARETYT